MYIFQSQSSDSSHPLTPFLLGIHTFVLYICASNFHFVNKIVYTNFFFQISHIFVNYNISFSLSDLLHSVWQSLGPSMTLQMTRFLPFHHGLLKWQGGKESACQCRRHKRCRFNPWVGKIPWNRKCQPTPIFLPRKLHGQRALEGYSP